MQSSLTQKNSQMLRILVAPLDWGLGHATRCIPIINALLHLQCQVLLAAEGKQAALLKKEFPQLTILPLTGYNVKYAKSKRGFLVKILWQIPRLLYAILKEQRWLKQVVKEHQIDAVISDNRYGLYHAHIPTVFITHQLHIKTGLGSWADKMVQKINYKFIQQFKQCWVPDSETTGLAGELSHPSKLPTTRLLFLNPISRFQSNTLSVQAGHLLILLSGPEPQRTLLEEKILQEIVHYNGTATVVRGLPGVETMLPSTNMIKFYNHLPSIDINNEMQKAEYVIARSGYTTIMDVAALQKKSILIPTPGQAEQEYLGHYLCTKKWALTVLQQKFSLLQSLQEAKTFSYQPLELFNNDKLKQVLEGWVQSINQGLILGNQKTKKT
ncbi:MAG: hypothetical protein RL115_2319 [Bacteroidota bacterium]|jgi:uncharacterized protein (TIGR00661 family)